MNHTAEQVSEKKVRPLFASVEQGRAWIDQAISSNAGRASGFIKIDDAHVHMANTSEGLVVSLVEWRRIPGETSSVSPSLNPFSVDHITHDKAVAEWGMQARNAEQADSVIRRIMRSDPVKPSVRSGARG